MNAHTRGSLVKNYKSLIDSLALPDPDDRHVLATAINAGAELIVTFNLRDFPTSALAPYNIEAIHPDKFIAELFETDAGAVFLAAKRQWQSLKNPPKPINEFWRF